MNWKTKDEIPKLHYKKDSEWVYWETGPLLVMTTDGEYRIGSCESSIEEPTEPLTFWNYPEFDQVINVSYWSYIESPQEIVHQKINRKIAEKLCVDFNSLFQNSNIRIIEWLLGKSYLAKVEVEIDKKRFPNLPSSMYGIWETEEFQYTADYPDPEMFDELKMKKNLI